MYRLLNGLSYRLILIAQTVIYNEAMRSQEADKKEVIRGVFSRGANNYRKVQFFQVFGPQLVEAAGVKAGMRVLDVACGRGASLFPAAEKVGQTGEVVGIDLSDGMAQETKTEVEKRGIKNAQVLQMDAEDLQFADNSFDVLMAGFALQFFPDLHRGLTEFFRVLKPGGRVAVATWAEYEDPRWAPFEKLIDHYGARASLGSNSLNTPEKIKPWFAKAGFVDTETSSRKLDTVYPTEDDYWNMRMSISGRAGLEKLSPSDFEKLKADLSSKIQATKNLTDTMICSKLCLLLPRSPCELQPGTDSTIL
jgi:ubiquinone/menaquinone biosynthesis C-methylase UbiE